MELLIISGPHAGTRHKLHHRFVVGRHPGNELFLIDQKSSRRHAMFVKMEGKLHIQDLGSRNGTFVNGTRISDVTPVSVGDKVRIGGTDFEIAKPEIVDLPAPVRVVDNMGRTSQVKTVADSQAPRVVQPIGEGQWTDQQALGEADLSALMDKARLVDVFYRLAKDMDPNLGIRQMLNRFLRVVYDALNADYAYVLMRSEEKAPDLQPVAMLHREPGDLDVIQVSQQIVSMAMEQGEAVLLSETQASGDDEAAGESAAYSAMCVPLLAHQGIVGMVSLGRSLEGGAFNDRDLDLVTALTSLIAPTVGAALVVDHQHMVIKQLQKTQGLDDAPTYAEHMRRAQGDFSENEKTPSEPGTSTDEISMK